MNLKVILALLGSGFVIFCAIMGIGLYLAFQPKNPLPPREEAGEGRRDLIAAFKDRDGEPAPKDFQQFFDEFGKCLRAGGAGGERYWSVERFARELDRDGALRRAGTRPDDRGILQGLRTGMVQMMSNLSVTLAYDSTEVRGVKFIVPDREAVVITRHSAQDQGETIRFKMRWWLINDNGWRAYDMEEAAIAGRSSELGGAVFTEVVARGVAGVNEQKVRVASFLEAQACLARAEFDKAERLLADPDLELLPTSLRPFLKVWRAIVKVRLEKFPEALTLINEIEKAMPDCPVLHYMLAACYSSTAEWDKVLVAGRKYIDLIGEDEDICIYMGNAYHGLDRRPEAAVEYRKALDDVPESETALMGLIISLKPEEKGELAVRFARFKDPASHLSALIVQAGEDNLAIEMLVGVVRKKSPNDPEGLFQDARLNLLKDKEAESIKLFLQASEKAGEERARFVRRFTFEMMSRGKGVAAYKAVPDADRDIAFQSIAGSLADEEPEPAQLKQVEELLDVHRENKPKDAWLPYYQGNLYHARMEYDLAEKAYADACSREVDDQTRETFRWSRVENLAGANRIGEAYAKVGPRRETFQQLASRLREDHDLPTLGTLIWIHAKAEPKDPKIFLWRGNLRFRKGDYESAVKELKAYRSSQADPAKINDWLFKEQLVRSLLRLKRFEEARKELRPSNKELYYNRLLDAAITAATGDVEKTEKVLEELIQIQRYEPAAFYADADLGPLLRTEPFKKLLEKYPPPKVEGKKI